MAIATKKKLWGIEDDGAIAYDLHPGQADVWNSPARFKAAIAGTGGGKTAMGPLWAYEQCRRVMESRDVRNDPIVGLVLAPTYRMLARATSKELISFLNKSPLRGRYLESKGYYELPKKWGKIWVLSTDDPDKIEGGQSDFAWMDEAGQMKYEAWANTLNRLGLRHAPALLTTTPYDLGWLKKKFVDLADAGNKDYYYRQWSSIDNPAYSREHYEEMKLTLAPHRFDMKYRGRFSVPLGLVYPWFANCIRAYSEAEVPPGVMVGGMDWGYSPDPRATLAAVKTRPMVEGAKDHLWIFFERYKQEEITMEHARLIPRDCRYWVDSSGGEEVEIMRRAGHKVRKNMVKSIGLGIDSVTRRLKTGTITFHPDACPNLIEEAGEYRWPTKDDEAVAGEPLGPHHALDALRYLIVNIDRGQLGKAA